MISRVMIRDRAVRMAIATGDMPEVDLIWAVQKTEGNQPCFGQGLGCAHLDCRWRGKCTALDFHCYHAEIS